jgi:hypothetical protein
VADGIRADKEDGEWEVELVSAVVEALADEEECEDAGELLVLLWSLSSVISITDGPKESMMLTFFISCFT